MERTRSGLPIVQPSTLPVHSLAGGASASAPAGAPLVAQETRVAICFSSRVRSFSNTLWNSADACQGGIVLASTWRAIDFAQARVSLYSVNDIGATMPPRLAPPGR